MTPKKNIISKETNDHIAVWEGENKERALAVTGIKTIGCKILKRYYSK
jgi:hypothetical protein